MARRSTSNTPNNARARALALLERQAARFPNLAIEDCRTDGLARRDAALAHAITDASIRRWLTLTHLLRPLVRQRFERLEACVRGALLGGSAQLLLMDRLPPYSVIDETVQWVKARRGKGAAGLVNAVLRRIARLRCDETVPMAPSRPRRDLLWRSDGSALRLASPCLPEDPWKHLAIQCSVAPPLVRRWRAHMDDDDARDCILHALTHPPIVLCVEHVREPLPAALIRPHNAPGHAVFVGEGGTLAPLLEGRPDIWVQDPSSSAGARLLEGLDPGVIVDLCAGRGTKARQLALMFPQARVVATDVDATRMEDLRTVASLYDNLLCVPMGDMVSAWASRADIVVCDVPCSNTGVLARRREARYRLGERLLHRLIEQQREIVRSGAALLKSGGYLLYATCSLEPEENEKQVHWMIAELGFDMVREQRTMPSGIPGDPPEGYRDGAYACLLRSRGVGA